MAASEQPPRIPPIIAHRGAPRNYPENSLASYKAVLNMALLYPQVKLFIETDMRTTCDHVCVGMHDERIDRTSFAQGRVADVDWEQIRNLRLHSRILPGKPLNFEQMWDVKTPQSPLWPIKRAYGATDNDFRPVRIEELLDITAQTNCYRARLGGAPVGLCLDLKSTVNFDDLAHALNDYFAAHPDAELPLLALGIRKHVSDAQLEYFWELLNPEAQAHFYGGPREQVVREAHLHRDRTSGAPIGKKIVSGIVAGVGNALTPWRFIGDPDPFEQQSDIGEKGQKLRANYPSKNTLREVVDALRRQDMVWTNCAPETMRYIQAREEGRSEQEAQQSARLPESQQITL